MLPVAPVLTKLTMLVEYAKSAWILISNVPATAFSGIKKDKVYSFLPSVPVCPAVKVTGILSYIETETLYPVPLMTSFGIDMTLPFISVMFQPRNILSVFGLSLSTVCSPIG